jgi:hypothetical protein
MSAREQSTDRRTQRRIAVGLPMTVRGTDAGGIRFEDASQTHNVSRTGVSFLSSRELKLGMDVEITISREGAKDSDFQTLAHVVRVEAASESPEDAPQQFLVGVQFIGPRFHRVFVNEG